MVDQVLESGFQHPIRFVEVSGVEQKTAVRHLEMTIGLPDAAFSQQEELITKCERVDGCGPLFEGDV